MNSSSSLLSALIVCLCACASPSGAATPLRRPVFAPPKPAYLSKEEYEVLAELNLARTAPREYAAHLKDLRRHYGKDGAISLPGKTPVISVEGVKAVDEAIAFLEKAQPLPALEPSAGLSRAARDHASDIGSKGDTGHTGSDKSTIPERLSRYGTWQQLCGENIACGWAEARHVVMQLIIDDNVPGRGHRKNIFTREYGKVGIAMERHKTYRHVCVMDFAGNYVEKAPPATVTSAPATRQPNTNTPAR